MHMQLHKSLLLPCKILYKFNAADKKSVCLPLYTMSKFNISIFKANISIPLHSTQKSIFTKTL